MERSCLTIVLAAGEGTRMKSNLPKVLHPIAGRPMLLHILAIAKQAGAGQRAVITGNQAELVTKVVRSVDGDASFHVQKERLGTAHAVLAARDVIDPTIDDVVVLAGDVPLITEDTIARARAPLADGADLVVLGFSTDDPTGYGRMIMDGENLLAIREHKDCTEAELRISFCNSGILAFRGAHVLAILDAIGNDNVKGEYYLTDAVEVAREKGLIVRAIDVPEEQTLGVNDRAQLSDLERRWQVNKRKEMLLAGVSMAAPETVHFSHDTEIGRDSVVEPNVVFAPGVRIGENVTIRSFSHLEGAVLEEGVVAGPFARLRPGTHLGPNSKVGNFVETKNTRVENGAKINHLSYIGDATVGAAANIGAGTITCNYDGFNKHKTTIGAGAFIGTNTALVAPIEIGANANTAAGSVITKSVPEDALAIERTDQRNLEGKARSLRERLKRQKERTG